MNVTNKALKTIAVSTPILLALDFFFIYLIMNNYGKMIANVQGSPMRFNIYGGIICYILIIASLYYFILKDRRSVKDAFLLGFFVYGILETTNYAILTNWNPIIALFDTVWGGVLYAGTAYLTYYFLKL
jgi:uncharacterized membrane protein